MRRLLSAVVTGSFVALAGGVFVGWRLFVRADRTLEGAFGDPPPWLVPADS